MKELCGNIAISRPIMQALSVCLFVVSRLLQWSPARYPDGSIFAPHAPAATLETMRSYVANGLGVGLSYTLPRTPQSYDGKPVHALALSDALAPEPIVIASNRMNPMSPTAAHLVEAIAQMQLL